MRRDRLVRMALGTYHTDQTVPSPSVRSWAAGKPSAVSRPSRADSGWAAVKSAAAWTAAVWRSWG